MTKKVIQLYEAVYYDGWGTPAYYMLNGVEGESPEQALQANLQRLTTEVRELFQLSPADVPDEKIQETLYIIRSDGLVPVSDVK